ncbi:hypothetical protein ACFO0H_03975 [Haloarchaeobius iranensis]|uniref:Uncharacterized protein n=2 Tax=Haloarchaeobius iranensis TaxID=996166 RepID=A0A1G9TTH8_9EURY|nr:hypothetical protein SAMN05192554_103125 [Haloarchaeobius iranensis]
MIAIVAAALVFAASLGVVAGVSTTGQAGETNVTILAHYPTEDGSTNETLLTAEDLASVGEPEAGTGGGYRIPVTLTQAGAESFTTTLVENGFTTTGAGNCEWGRSSDDPGYCLLTVVDGEVTAWHALGPALADSIESGAFEQDPRFVVTAANETAAQRIAAALREDAGAGTPVTDGDGGGVATDTAAAAAGTDDGTADTAGEQTDGSSTPGFTVVTVLAAVVVATVLGRVRA